MSIKFISAAFAAEALKPTPRFVLIALADHANDRGLCYPSISRLARRTGFSGRAIQTAIKHLRETGYVEVKPNAGKQGSNLYRLRLEPETDASPHIVQAEDAAPAPRTTCVPPSEGDAPKPSFNHQEPSVSDPHTPSLQTPPEHDQTTASILDKRPGSHGRSIAPIAGGFAEGCTSITEEFEKIWGHYPRKVGKGAARKVWARVRRDKTFTDIAEPLALWIEAQRGTEMRFIPHFSTWLGQERWTDEPSHAAIRSATTSERLDRLDVSESQDPPSATAPRNLPKLDWER